MLLHEVGQMNKEWGWRQFFCKRRGKKKSLSHKSLWDYLSCKNPRVFSHYFCLFLKKAMLNLEPKVIQTFACTGTVLWLSLWPDGFHSVSLGTCHSVVKSTLAPRLAGSAWETRVCPGGGSLYLTSWIELVKSHHFHRALQCLDVGSSGPCQTGL